MRAEDVSGGGGVGVTCYCSTLAWLALSDELARPLNHLHLHKAVFILPRCGLASCRGADLQVGQALVVLVLPVRFWLTQMVPAPTNDTIEEALLCIHLGSPTVLEKTGFQPEQQVWPV